MASRPLLREARRSVGLTQQELAGCLDVDQAVIARWETGAREPRVRAAVRLSEVLGTTANAIWPASDLNESGPAALERPGP